MGMFDTTTLPSIDPEQHAEWATIPVYVIGERFVCGLNHPDVRYMRIFTHGGPDESKRERGHGVHAREAEGWGGTEARGDRGCVGR